MNSSTIYQYTPGVPKTDIPPRRYVQVWMVTFRSRVGGRCSRYSLLLSAALLCVCVHVELCVSISYELTSLEIRESRLYRNGYETFEDYCRDRWDMTHQHADRLIASSNVIENLTPIGVIQPVNESQARPLTRLVAPLQIEAWKKFIETAQVGNRVGILKIEK